MDRIPDREAEHRRRSGALASQLLAARGGGVSVGLEKKTSNLFRRRERGPQLSLDVRRLNHVLSVDRERMTADVEGMTTYGTLVDETLRCGLLPAVVPQLKTITAGGAVSGLGIESSSFRYGLVHESVEAMGVLTGAGSIVVCSPDRNPDLFFGFPNSYGTLGYALRLTLRLVPARPFVRLTHTRFPGAREFFARLPRLCDQGGADFVDGAIFGKDEFYVTQASFSEDAPQVSDYTYMKIYYRSIQQKRDDWLTSKDYIWRWDTDWFWCSRHFGVQNAAVRLFAKRVLNSRAYQRLMRLSQRLLPESPSQESVIQDVQIPIDRCVEFCEFLLSQVGITPVWVCPFRTSDRTYDLCPLQPDQLYVNFGFWDTVPTKNGRGHYNRMIERKVAALGGTKALYSTSYYDEETFWGLYDKARYLELKRTYDPDSLFPDLYAKCVGRK